MVLREGFPETAVRHAWVLLCGRPFEFWGSKGKKKENKVLSLSELGRSFALQSYIVVGSLPPQTKFASVSCFLFAFACASNAVPQARGAPGQEAGKSLVFLSQGAL